MKHICAWCKRETAPADGAADDDLISHGMCDECSKFVMAGKKDRGRESEDRKGGGRR